MNDAQCIDGMNDYQCMCRRGFAGRFCDEGTVLSMGEVDTILSNNFHLSDLYVLLLASGCDGCELVRLDVPLLHLLPHVCRCDPLH